MNQLQIDLNIKSEKVEKQSLPRVNKIPGFYRNEITEERAFNVQMKKEKDMEEDLEKLRPKVKAIVRLQENRRHEISKQNCG